MRYDNQLRYAVSIVKDYDGRYPLAAWLKDFFRSNKQMGSRDRKTVAEMVYGYYRLGHHPFPSIEEKILAGIFLGNNLPELVSYFTQSLSFTGEKIQQIRASLSPQSIFPWVNHLSQGIDSDLFARSFLTQPDLFLRTRPGKQQQVTEKLSAAGISFRLMQPSCLSLANSTRVQEVLALNKEAVIQDRSSQQTGALLQDLHPSTVWDCCAASGGKAIMAYDLLPGIQLTVSDIRSSIMHNLAERLREAGITAHRSFTADLTDDNDDIPAEKYDLIIADLPCTGSGTWSRTPEQLYFFKEEKIDYYAQLQQRILDRVTGYLRPGGSLLYITCSVFARENEEQVKYMLQKHRLQVKKTELFKGYSDRADTLFGALFTG